MAKRKKVDPRVVAAQERVLRAQEKFQAYYRKAKRAWNGMEKQQRAIVAARRLIRRIEQEEAQAERMKTDE